MMRIVCILICICSFSQAQEKKKKFIPKPCDPVLLAGNYKNGDTIAESDVGALRFIRLYHPCSKTITFPNNKFELTVGAGAAWESYGGSNFKLTPEMRKALVVVPAGGKIIIDNVSVKNKDGSYTLVPGATFIVGKISSVNNFDTSGQAGRDDKANVLSDFMKSPDKNVVVNENIHYASSAFEVTSEIAEKLKPMAEYLKQNKSIKLEIYSHTDSRGNDAANLTLSKKRADAIAAYFVQQGIDKSRLLAKGMGETRLFNKCANGVDCTEKEHEVNRRTEFKFVK